MEIVKGSSQTETKSESQSPSCELPKSKAALIYAFPMILTELWQDLL